MSIPPYVHKADDNRVIVKLTDTNLQHELIQNGFIPEEDSSDTFSRTVLNDIEKGDLFYFLRDRGFAWSRGHEWCPAEVFEWLRDQRIVSGTFKSIAWVSPTKWSIRDE